MESALLFTGKPSAPSGPLSIESATETSVTLTWNPPESDGGSAVTVYVIEKREVTSSTWTTVDALPAGATPLTYTVTDLTVGQAYVFRVAAENQAGLGPYLETTVPVTLEKEIRKYFF